MLQWEKSVCQCDSYSVVPHLKGNIFSPRPTSNSPRLSVCALVMSAYLLLFFILLLICLPQELKRMKEPTKQHILNLNVHV